jgi:tetratricopeptide (TPR) repeat protein
VARSFEASAFRELHLDEEDLERARQTGEQAAAMAERLGRADLQSAALDGIADIHISVGRFGEVEGPVRRRLELVPKLSDPYEIGDIHAQAAWWALSTGRYRESVDQAGRGFEGATPGSPLQALYSLDFRVAARFRLGEWDEALADVSLAEELMGDRRDSPPGFAPMHLGIAAFIHDVRGDRVTASRYLGLVRWLEQVEERLDPVLTLWQSRLLARRGDFEEARALLEREAVVETLYSRDEVLEAWCEVISEEGTWDEAPKLAEQAAAHAARAGVPPLALFATRLGGRVAGARGSSERAVQLLTSAIEGFTGLEAVWEAAVTRLDLAEVLVASDRVEAARRAAEVARPVFERLGSVRELARADQVLGRPT